MSKNITIQCDASQYGLGSTLLQDGRPVHYANRALSRTEQNYAQIEKELLAIVFSCERFEHYLYGKQVTVETDHKPLIAIPKKPMNTASKRLQCTMLCLQKYDLVFTYKAVNEMHIVDAISRALPHRSQKPSTSHSCRDLETVNFVEDLPISESTLAKIQAETAKKRISTSTVPGYTLWLANSSCTGTLWGTAVRQASRGIDSSEQSGL